MTIITYESIPNPRPDLLVQAYPGEHVWVATSVFRISANTLRQAAGHRLDLDKENLATIELGCWICEEPYSARLRERPCPGDPADTAGA